MKKIIIILIFIGVVVGITYAVAPRQSETPQESAVESASISLSPTVNPDYIKYAGREGRSAFELLREIAEVEYQQYDFGVFVESINWVEPNEGYFWKLYINGTDAQVGADQLQTRNNDVIEWKMEQITND